MTPLSRVSANFPIFGCHSLCSFGGLPALRKQFHDNDHVWGHGVREQGMFITVILLLCSNNNSNKHNWWCAEDHHHQRQHHRHQYFFLKQRKQRKISINRLHIKSKIHMLSVWSWGCCCGCLLLQIAFVALSFYQCQWGASSINDVGQPAVVDAGGGCLRHGSLGCCCCYLSVLIV